MLVGAIIVNDYMKILMRVFSIEMFQEIKELNMGVGIHASSLYKALMDEQGGKQARCAMPGVSMGLALCPVWSQWQHRLGSIQGLDL